MGFSFSWKWGVAGCVSVAALVLYLYVNNLRDSNEKLTKDINTLQVAFDSQVKISNACSDSVQEMSDAATKQTQDAKKAVEQAKKEAKASYDKAYALLQSRPKPPVVTEENAVEYGGSNKDEQLKDYINTHALFNQQLGDELE